MMLLLWAMMPALSQKVESSDSKSMKKDAAKFTDELFTRLKPGAAISEIRDTVLRRIAREMQAGCYPATFRIQIYEAYPVVREVAKKLKTSTYNQFENPTGIYFLEDEDVMLFISELDGEQVMLRVHDWGPDGGDQSYPLQSGTNRIKIKNKGLGYISYYTDNWQQAKPVRVHIPSGRVNGYFDSGKHSGKDWKSLLESAVCDIIDIRGKYVQLAYPVEAMKEFCPGKGLELMQLYDSIIRIQYDLMGLIKYDKCPKNRMFGRVIWKGYMHADGTGAAFHNSTMKTVGNPDALRKNSWGVAHEFGHVNQTRPGMKWVSTTEVTNNIFSIWTQHIFSPDHLRLEDEVINSGDGRMLGGRFNAYLNSGIVCGEPWLCQQGPDKMKGYENGGDHFVKLCPLWQLQLYYGAAGQGNPDLFADVTEIVRNTDERKMSNGRLQLNFIKNACDVQKEDLTDFFMKAGLLKPIDRYMDDYTKGQLTITEADCRELVEYAKRYPKPVSPVIYYISGHCVAAYRDRLAVEGHYNKGVKITDKALAISHDVWKNVTVFETYKGDELIRLAMVGSGSSDNSSTLVQYPEGATRVEAVAWDGARTLVYGKR